MSRRKLELVTAALPVTRPAETGSPRGLFWLGAGVYVFSLLMIGGGILFAPPGQPTRWFDEKQTETSYSAALLYTCVLVSALNFLAARNFFYPRLTFRPLKTFWALGAVGFFVLMADEFFAMHEGIGGRIAYRILNLAHTSFHDRFDGFIILFYGVCGLVILATYWRWLKLIPGFRPFLIAGGVFGALSVFMDLQPETIWGIYMEEGAKIMANASFLLACSAAALKNYQELLADMRASSARERDALAHRRRTS
ncbi:MAG TPA: hypothetical protein VFY29_08355 [Terriglobia bacterium]|nr:hypothetical protein [Terriglobia bacterium]